MPAAWTAPRTWAASEVPTSANFNAHIRDNLMALNGFARKSVTESVTSSTTLQNDDNLSYSLDDAGGRYEANIYMRAVSAANAAGDIKVGFTFPSGSFLFTGFGPDIGLASGTVQTGDWAALVGTGTSTGTLSFGLSTAGVGIHLNLLVTPGTTGTLQFQWAQNSSSASQTSIVGGSYMTVKQVQ